MASDDIPKWGENVVQALLSALRQRDPYTYGHCRRVARNARLLAKAAGLTEKEQRIVEYSALLHDVGKMGIPDRILSKTGHLSDEEEEIMKEHPVRSVQVIEPLLTAPFFRSLVPGIRHHHERIDGEGYPDRMKGEQIPLYARIILVSDTFDAMTTTRPYRQGLGSEYAYKELRQFAGRQFDAHLVRVFLKAHPTWGNIEEEISEEFVASHFKRAA